MRLSGRTLSLTAAVSPRHRRRGMASSAASLAPPSMRAAVTVDEVDRDLYVGRAERLWVPPGLPTVFGGQIAACAAMAAQLSTPPDLALASLHSYFLAPGLPDRDVVYKVARIRDGRSFATRSVQAVQGGQPIFSAEVQFHVREDPGGELGHQEHPPSVPPPDSLPSLRETYARLAADLRVPPTQLALLKQLVDAPFPVDFRPCDAGWDPLAAAPQSPPARRRMWMRCTELLHADDAHVRRASIIYQSDWLLASTMLLPHGLHFASDRVGLMTSLDHVIHFAAGDPPCGWLLHDMESPLLRGARGINVGRIFSQSGLLAAHCVQEALVRLRSWRGQGTREPRPAADAAQGGGAPPAG